MLVRRGIDGQWHEPESSGYPTEEALQLLLEQSPFLLPWDLSEGLVFAREVSLPPAGYADLLGVGISGEIVLVECKLRSNAETRRHVVGQILAYASTLWQMPFDVFAEHWGAARKTPLLQCVEGVARESGAVWSAEAFQDAVSANLAAGRLRLLVAVDQIADELRGIVEFVNTHTVPDLQLLALQLEYLRDGDMEILSPTIYAQETVHSAWVRGTQTTEEALFAALRVACSAEGYSAVRHLYEWSMRNGVVPYWGKGQSPSVTAWFHTDDGKIAPWSIWATAKNANVSVNFEYIVSEKFPQDRVEEFLRALEIIPVFAPKLTGVRTAQFKKRPGILIDPALAMPRAMDALGRALAELLGKRWDDGAKLDDDTTGHGSLVGLDNPVP